MSTKLLELELEVSLTYRCCHSCPETVGLAAFSPCTLRCLAPETQAARCWSPLWCGPRFVPRGRGAQQGRFVEVKRWVGAPMVPRAPSCPQADRFPRVPESLAECLPLDRRGTTFTRKHWHADL